MKTGIVLSQARQLLGGMSLVLMLLLGACSSASASGPPYRGVFLIGKGGEFQEMTKGTGGRPSSGIPLAISETPTIAVADGNVNAISLLPIVPYGSSSTDYGRLGKELNVAVSWHDEYAELKPADPLGPGQYCLIEEDAFRSAGLHPWWCFEVGGSQGIAPQVVGAGIGAEGSDGIEKPIDFDVIDLPSAGMFVYVDGELVELIERISRDDQNSTTIRSAAPVFLTNRSDVSVTNLLIVERLFGIGLTRNRRRNDVVEVWSVEGGHGAQAGGVRPGDVILGVDGNDIQGNWDHARTLMLGREFTPVNLTILRGAVTIDVAVERTMIIEHRPIAVNYEPKGNLTVLTPYEVLRPGDYFLFDRPFKPSDSRLYVNPAHGWAFRVELE